MTPMLATHGVDIGPDLRATGVRSVSGMQSNPRVCFPPFRADVPRETTVLEFLHGKSVS